MTTWTLSELSCQGNCQQGRLSCDCQSPIVVNVDGATFSYKPPTETSSVIVNSETSYEPIPFAGMVKVDQ